MALANHRIRVFQNVNDMEQFIRNDTDITSIITITTDDNGSFVLVYDIT